MRTKKLYNKNRKFDEELDAWFFDNIPTEDNYTPVYVSAVKKKVSKKHGKRTIKKLPQASKGRPTKFVWDNPWAAQCGRPAEVQPRNPEKRRVHPTAKKSC